MHLGVALLAAFTFVPLGVTLEAQAHKVRVSRHLAGRLLQPHHSSFTVDWLTFLRHPTSAVNVLKSLYSMCMASGDMCLHVSRDLAHLSALCDLATDKTEAPSNVANESVELAVHTLSTVIIQLFDMPIRNSSSLTWVLMIFQKLSNSECLNILDICSRSAQLDIKKAAEFRLLIK